MTTQRQDITGTPNWGLARDIIAQLREMPAATAEAEVEVRLYNALSFLFPGVRYPELATQYPSGDGPIDVYCRNAVFETKRQGKLDARPKPDGTLETPEEQAVRYLDALTAQPNMFADAGIGWRAGVTDGKEWFFYDYHQDAPAGAKLTLLNTLRLDTPDDGENLLAYLYDFVNRTVKMAPPTDNREWVERLVNPIIELSERYRDTSEYEVKHKLWEGVLRGAFIIPPDAADARRELFARHTLLVVIARAVAATLRPPEPQTEPQPAAREQLHRTLTEGFAAWLLDAAGTDGSAAIAALVTEVNNYAWSAANRDTLKDLYHAVISRDIRHDFGEYYTPDWLARAVCEEVLDPEWRRAVIDQAVKRELAGPAVLDPACGSGTFLFHATQLLLEEAQQHPELADSREAQTEIVNQLVAGMDLHPVAVELAKTTKMLAFSNAGMPLVYAENFASIHLGDSLQWETLRNEELFNQGNLVTIPAEESSEPVLLPRSLLLSEHFSHLINLMFDYAENPDFEGAESTLAAALDLPNAAEQAAALAAYRRFRGYIHSERNRVWRWYISNMAQPIRLARLPATRLVGNPPWVVYNAMDNDRQNAFREHAQSRRIWSAGTGRAPQNDLAATFVATCVDYYLQTGGKFGFVLPYAALRARQWAPFRTGDWSLQQDAERGTYVDLSKDAWDFSGVNAPPFPQAQSSVVFGTKVRADNQSPALKPLHKAVQIVGDALNTNMSWSEVKPRLRFTQRPEWPIAPSAAYAAQVLNGTNLFPQSLLVFDRPLSRSRGVVYFRTNPAKGIWRNTDRDGNVEERFVKQAVFSRLLLPFGTSGHSHIVAPFAADGKSVLQDLPQGGGAQRFNIYWSSANAVYVQTKRPKSPDTLAKMVDYINHLTAQLRCENDYKVIYNSSGGKLYAAVVRSDLVCSHTLCWLSPASLDECHYLAAIFNTPALAEFFSVACRASDRDFIHLPVQNLPIPAYAAANPHHANLAAQSQQAHQRVAALVAERQALGRRINRNDVLRDAAMQPILASIDESVRAILPDYCA